MKNGTTPFEFLPGNERSRTDVPYGTCEISHGPCRRAMANSSQTFAAALASGCPSDRLPSRRHRRDPLRPAQWLRLATPPPRLSELEDRLRGFPQVAQRRNLAEDPRFV